MRTNAVNLIISGAFSIPMIFLAANSAMSQSNRLPNADSPSKYQGVAPGSIVYDEGDFDPPPTGQVMMAHWKDLVQINQKISVYLQTAPDDITGKQSSWYPQLEAWKSVFDQFITTKSGGDLMALVPGMLAYWNRDQELEMSPEMLSIQGEMQAVNYYIVQELASKVAASNGELNATDLSRAVGIFAIPGLVDQSLWSDEPIPICESGIMIIDANAVVAQLKLGPWQQAKQFLGGSATASEFFSRYAATGDGLSVLKTKYVANQSAIDSKFNELKTWVDAQEQQAGNGD